MAWFAFANSIKVAAGSISYAMCKPLGSVRIGFLFPTGFANLDATSLFFVKVDHVIWLGTLTFVIDAHDG